MFRNFGGVQPHPIVFLLFDFGHHVRLDHVVELFRVS
jgi:hypothetical protein